MSASPSPLKSTLTATGVAPAYFFANSCSFATRSSVSRSAGTRSSSRLVRFSRTALRLWMSSTMSSGVGVSSSRWLICTVPDTRMGSSDLSRCSQFSKPGLGPCFAHLPSRPITLRVPSLPGKHTNSMEPDKSSIVTHAMRLPVFVGRSRSTVTMPATVSLSSLRARCTAVIGRA